MQIQKLKEMLFNKKENGWLSVNEDKENMIMKFSDEYIYFLNKGKTVQISSSRIHGCSLYSSR